MSLFFLRSVHCSVVPRYMCWNNRESLQMAPETYIWHYMQWREVELFKGGLFCMIWWEISYSTYTIMQIYVWPFFFIPFEYFWLLICCSLTFCSLGYNKISEEGARELAAALQVNQSLQELKWVQPFMSSCDHFEIVITTPMNVRKKCTLLVLFPGMC